MNKTLKRLLLVLAALFALALAVLAYVVATFDPNAYKPRLIELVRAHTGRALSIPGDIRLTLWPRIGAQLGAVSLSEPGQPQVFAAMQDLRVSVALWPLLARQVVVEQIAIDGLQLHVTRDRDGRYNFADLLPAPAAPQTSAPPRQAPADALALNVGGIRLRNARIDYRDAASARQLSVAVSNFVSGPIADGRSSHIQLNAELQGHAPAMWLKLDLETGFTPQLTQPAIALQDLRLKLTAQTVSRQNLQLQLRGRLHADLRQRRVRLALDGQLDQTTLALQATIQQLERPDIDFDVALGELDIDRYLPARAATVSGAAPARGGPAADPVIDLSVLRWPNLRGTLKAQSVKFINLKASELRLQLRAHEGRAELTSLTASLYGGAVQGGLSVGAGQPQRLAAKLDLRDVQLGPLLQDLLARQPIDGRGQVMLDVQTSGNTLNQLKRNLNGLLTVQLRDGAIHGINLGAALRDAKARLSGGASGQPAAQEKTDFSELGASFRIRDGVAHNDDLAGKSPLLRLGGSGDVFLAEDRLDYTFQVTVVPTLQGQGGPELEQLRGLTIPVRIRGPYQNPGWQLDWGATPLGRAREQLEQRKAQLQQEAQRRLDEEKAQAQQRLQQQAEDRLKQLLGR